MRNELTTERQNALPSTDYVVMIVPPKHTVLSMPSTTQGLQGRCLLQHTMELEKHLNGDDNGRVFSICGCWLLVLQAMRLLKSLEQVFPPPSC